MCSSTWPTTIFGFLLLCGKLDGAESYAFQDKPLSDAILNQYNCTDGDVWKSLMDSSPYFLNCGHRFKNLQSYLSQSNPELHYSNLGEFPSLANVITELDLIEKTGKKITQRKRCDGFLFTDQHVLTAASCLTERMEYGYNRAKRVVKVVLGDYNLENTGKDCVSTTYNTTCPLYPTLYRVEKIVTYPHFNIFSLHHDIAILLLDKAVRLTYYIHPICIPHGCWFDNAGKAFQNNVLNHVGWEIFFPNKATNIKPKEMQKVKRVIVSPERSDGSEYGCDSAYLWFDNFTQLCTHDYPLLPEDQNNCNIPAGGPLIAEYGNRQFAMAIASFNEDCNIQRTVKNGDPLVMTWLLPYTRWILKTVYHLVNGQEFSRDFIDIKWSTGSKYD